jgi:hypothetical protein
VPATDQGRPSGPSGWLLHRSVSISVDDDGRLTALFSGEEPDHRVDLGGASTANFRFNGAEGVMTTFVLEHPDSWFEASPINSRAHALVGRTVSAAIVEVIVRQPAEYTVEVPEDEAAELVTVWRQAIQEDAAGGDDYPSDIAT